MKKDSSKEWVLNIAFNRWQFNRPKYVGKLSEAIRACAPKNLEEWKAYHYENVRPQGEMLASTMQEHLEEIGRRLYVKISEQLHAEVSSITEEDCIRYVEQVVFNRTYEGYVTEKRTIYEQLEEAVGEKIYPAPDKWDRRYNIDFFIQVGKRYIGIQIKPISYHQMPEAHKWKDWLLKSHEDFTMQMGGRVFVVLSAKEGAKKKIVNSKVISAIREEITRLRQETE